jgi:exocyst complex component 4
MGHAPDGAYLPLDSETAKQFDAVVTSFTELSLSTLRMLHIDLRLHVLHGIYAAMDTTYALGQPYNDPDPAILTLSTALASYDAVISASLLGPQYAFLTAHLHVLANNALTSLVGCIAAMDEHGCGRMQLNVLVLQQSLKTAMQQDANLEMAGRFYSLAEEGPVAIAREGAKGGYAREDLKALVRLCWDEERDGRLGTVDDFVSRLS